MRSGLGIGLARPPETKATCTSASTIRSVAAHHLLIEGDGGALHLLRRGDDVEHVVHEGRLVEVDVHVAHDEGKARRLLLGRLEQRAVVGADQPQVIGAPALHEAQVARVIDDAGEIGVLVIDAHLLVVLAVLDDAVEVMLRLSLAKGRMWSRVSEQTADREARRGRPKRSHQSRPRLYRALYVHRVDRRHEPRSPARLPPRNRKTPSGRALRWSTRQPNSSSISRDKRRNVAFSGITLATAAARRPSSHACAREEPVPVRVANAALPRCE